ncbi:thiopurine S-methyltransferase [Alkalisalibacterium limincola]|uniref:Thiopurine S-methyltransferase n=1 Tax=Alkalisalibacterium limincola TaxID=2699169 RepID=A0A5C8KPP4_9GAMM|nr:thiopurine S-methyltransferase [Alkalisalibacterium limincola]TXK62142.1 thiopurine S-methyltransferase [Alkalisalibacterium limincola]
MEAEFWHARWAEGRTGWHLEEVNRLLLKHWPSLALPAEAPVLVPLCGKSLDMAWLAAEGHPVLGVELSLEACREFFAERGLDPGEAEEPGFTRVGLAHLELLAGDVFALAREHVQDIAAVYDRAALIALPEAMRRRYVEHVYGLLPAGTLGLLVTLEYPAHERDGPPFSVDETEVRALFEPRWQVDLLERRDILEHEPRFAIEGVSTLHTCVYRLSARD